MSIIWKTDAGNKLKEVFIIRHSKIDAKKEDVQKALVTYQSKRSKEFIYAMHFLGKKGWRKSREDNWSNSFSCEFTFSNRVDWEAQASFITSLDFPWMLDKPSMPNGVSYFFHTWSSPSVSYEFREVIANGMICMRRFQCLLTNMLLQKRVDHSATYLLVDLSFEKQILIQ